MAKHEEVSLHLPHFFRIILPPHILENGTLELPRKFVKEHGKNLSNYACLKLPTGKASKVELKRCNDRAWLCQGWHDFANKYSIQCGYFLLFRYKGGSCFNVRIYDLSTLEIEYPVSSATTSNKKEPTDDAIANHPTIGGHRVLERAKAFELQRPNLHFMVTMTPAYVGDVSYLHIPVGPARSYLCKKENRNMYLSLNGKTWSMKYSIGVPPQLAVRVHWGWTQFSQENGLQEGDVCVFELVDSTALGFNVTIFRVTDEEGATVKREADHVERDMLQQQKAQMNVDERDVLCDFLSGSMKPPMEKQNRKRKSSVCVKESAALERATTFSIMMRKSYVVDWYRLTIPKCHSLVYLMDQHGNEAFLRRVDGEEVWPVSVYVRGSETRFSRGWKDFVVDNNLQKGDVCVFELLTQGPNHYKVTIVRGAES